MATIKSYTDINQSHKLAKILPLESADMHSEAIEISGDMVFVVVCSLGDKTKSNYGSPVWSLSALLSILPDELENNHFLTLEKEGKEYCCCYEDVDGNSFRHCFSDNPVDACVAMIEKLNELNLL